MRMVKKKLFFFKSGRSTAIWMRWIEEVEYNWGDMNNSE
jgi:hypothetical protein